MRRATQRAVERARNESLPTLLEARTYRYMGHSMSDPGNYRTRAEIEKYQERDPIKLFTAKLTDSKVLTDRDLSNLESEIKEQVEHALRFAEESPLPDPAELFTNVYAD
jgi:pyruvate dehydrogenase E1 component alpha subunit